MFYICSNKRIQNIPSGQLCLVCSSIIDPSKVARDLCAALPWELQINVHKKCKQIPIVYVLQTKQINSKWRVGFTSRGFFQQQLNGEQFAFSHITLLLRVCEKISIYSVDI